VRSGWGWGVDGEGDGISRFGVEESGIGNNS